MLRFRDFLRAIVEVGTSTFWKTAEYGAIAGARAQNGIHVEPLSALVSVHSAVEDENTAAANLAKKFRDIILAANPFRRGGAHYADFMQNLAARKLRFRGGNRTAMQRTYIMGDDTTLAIPTDIWNAMLPTLRRLVVADSLKASPHSFDGDPDAYMSVADIGPIMGAVGQKAFWQLLRRTAARIERYQNGAPVKVYHQVSAAVTRLSEPLDTQPLVVKAETLYHVYQPNGLLGEVPTLSAIPATEDFVCLPGDARPISSYYDDFLVNHSTRRKILDQIEALIDANESAIPVPEEDHFAGAGNLVSLRAVKKELGRLKVVQPSVGAIQIAGQTRTDIGPMKIRQHVFPGQTLDDPGFAAASAMEFYFGATDKKGQPLAESADVLIFPPFDHSDERLRAYNYLKLREALQARGIDRRYHDVPLIVLNHNDCWKEAIASHLAYANDGYNKEFVRAPVHDGLRRGEQIVTQANVVHLPLYHADVLSSDNQSNLVKAAEQVARFRLRDYHRVNVPTQGTNIKGTPRPDGMMVATVFASASSDRLVNYENGRQIGRLLGELGMGLCTGGGDQHLMVAPINGYNETRREGHSHLTCVSTHEIVKVETIHGCLPFCDYSELHDTIPPRLKTLKQIGDIFVSIGGGEGTGEETGHVLLEKLYGRGDAADKPMIFIGKDASMHAEISSILGDGALKALHRDPYALMDKGVLLFPNATSAEHVIRLAHAQHLKRQPLTGMPAPLPTAAVA